jgi:heme oxygenase
MAMSRKNYNEIAADFHRNVERVATDENLSRAQREEAHMALYHLAQDLADTFKQDNIRFKRETFMLACGFAVLV